MSEVQPSTCLTPDTMSLMDINSKTLQKMYFPLANINTTLVDEYMSKTVKTDTVFYPPMFLLVRDQFRNILSLWCSTRLFYWVLKIKK